MPLVTVDQAKTQLRVTIDDDDEEIESICIRATSILLDFLKREEDSWQETGSGDPVDVPGVIEAACLILVQNLYDGVDPVLTASVKDLVRRYRDPAIA